MLAVTLFPVAAVGPASGGTTAPTGPLPCLVCGEFGTADLVLNAVFFAPLGVLVALAAGRRRGLAAALLAGFALSAVVEAGQLLLPGRFTTLGDLIANTAGAGLGGLAVRWRAALLLPSEARAGLLSLAAGAAAGAVFLATGWLLVASPTGERNWVQWSPVLGHYEAHRGRVLDACLGELSLSPGRMGAGASRAAREAIRRGAPIAVTVRLGPPPAGLAPIVSLFDDRQRENLLLGQDGDDLVLRLRYRAEDARLRRPELRFRDALAGQAVGDTVRLTARRPPATGPATAIGPASSTDRTSAASTGPDAVPRADAYCLAAGRDERCGLGYPPGRGWSLLAFPRGLPAAALRALDGLWTALLFLPLGFWGVRGLEGSRRRSAAVGAALAAGGLLAAPVVTPLVAPGAAEAAGALAGLAVGALGRRWARRQAGGRPDSGGGDSAGPDPGGGAGEPGAGRGTDAAT